MAQRAPRTVDRFVRELDTELAERTVSDGTDAFARMKLRTIVSDCGWKARSKPRVAGLQAELEAAGVFPFPDLDDPDLGIDDWVRFSKSPGVDRPLGKIFGSEAGIQRFIHRYHNEVFADIPSLSGLKLHGREVAIARGQRRLVADLVFKDADRHFVLVEFKRGDPARGAPNQLREYMDAVRLSGKPVAKGILITAKPRSARLEELIAMDIARSQAEYPMEWYWYEVEVKLDPAPTESRDFS